MRRTRYSKWHFVSVSIQCHDRSHGDTDECSTTIQRPATSCTLHHVLDSFNLHWFLGRTSLNLVNRSSFSSVGIGLLLHAVWSLYTLSAYILGCADCWPCSCVSTASSLSVDEANKSIRMHWRQWIPFRSVIDWANLMIKVRTKNTS